MVKQINTQNAKAKQQKLNVNQHSALRTAHVCVYDCAQLSCTTAQKVLIVFPVILQIVIIDDMLSIGGDVTDADELLVHSMQCKKSLDGAALHPYAHCAVSWLYFLHCSVHMHMIAHSDKNSSCKFLCM